MRARRIPNGEGRLLSTKELMDYLRIGRNNAMIFGAEAGARVQIGRRVLYDRRIIDKANRRHWMRSPEQDMPERMRCYR